MTTRLENWLNFIKKNADYAECNCYVDWFQKDFSDEPVYKIIMSAGFQDLKSYYSVVFHERYLALYPPSRYIFISRNGQQLYNIEFGDVDLTLQIAETLDLLLYVNRDHISIDTLISKSLLDKIIELVKYL